MTRPRRGGFTLLEILISSALILVLLTGVWAVFDIFSSLEIRGLRQTARARLTRGLYVQLKDDLSQATTRRRRRGADPSWAVAIDSEDAGKPQNSESVDRPAPADDFAESLLLGGDDPVQPPEYAMLVGSRSWLILDLPVPPCDENVFASPLVPADNTNWTASEFRRRVVYHFVTPEELLSDNKLIVGLTRWQIHWRAAPLDHIIAELNNREWGTSSSLVWERPLDAGAGSALSFVAANKPQVEHEDIPELRRILFRYYNEDSGWQSSWNSTTTGRLPAAVQMRVLWRDEKETSDDVAAATDELDRPLLATGNAADRSPTEQMDEMRLLADWDKDVGTRYSATLTRPPVGYAEYLFVLPAPAGPIEGGMDDTGLGL